MKAVNIYLNYDGNTEDAFKFYKAIFGGEFAMLQRFKDTPQADNVSEAEKEKIMHISLPLANGYVLMATDALESMGHTVKPGNNFHITISTDSEKEADKIFNGLSKGGKVSMPMKKEFWGAYFGSLTDKFGIQWMISFDDTQIEKKI